MTGFFRSSELDQVLLVLGRIESDGYVSSLAFVDEEAATKQDLVGIELWTRGFDVEIARVKIGALLFGSPASAG
jgi:hypothetical protein